MGNGTKLMWVELLRLIACFSVILIHISAWCIYDIPFGETSWIVVLIYNSIGRFAVPIFVMISGMLYLNVNRQISFEKLFKKYVFRLLIVYISWAILYSAFDLLISDSKVMSVESLLYSALMAPKYHLWYLPMLISLLLVTPILKEVVSSQNSKKICEYIILLFFIFKVIKETVLKFNFGDPYLNRIFNLFSPDLVCNWIGFFVLGHYLYTYKIKSMYEKGVYFLGGAGVILGVYFNYTASLASNRLVNSYSSNFSLFTTISAIALFLLVKNFKTNKKYINTIIIKNSQYSLGIYLLHPFIRDVFQILGLKSYLVVYPVTVIVVYTILIFL